MASPSIDSGAGPANPGDGAGAAIPLQSQYEAGEAAPRGQAPRANLPGRLATQLRYTSDRAAFNRIGADLNDPSNPCLLTAAQRDALRREWGERNAIWPAALTVRAHVTFPF
jgi:hypothetical protein